MHSSVALPTSAQRIYLTENGRTYCPGSPACRSFRGPACLVAGDCVFITARPPKVTTESIPLDPPHGFFKRLWWDWFGEKCIVKKTEEEVWPAYDVIIMLCPDAGTRQTDATRAPQAATWRRTTSWRRRRAGGAHVRERGPTLASQPTTAWFALLGGKLAGALRVVARRGAKLVSL